MGMEFEQRVGVEAQPEVQARVQAQANMNVRYLRKRGTDETFGWTPVLALREDMLPCSKAMHEKLMARRVGDGALRSKNLNTIRVTAERKAEAAATILEETERRQAELLANEEEELANDAANAKAREDAENAARAKREEEAAAIDAATKEKEAAGAVPEQELDVTSPPPPLAEQPAPPAADLAEMGKPDLMEMAKGMGIAVSGSKGDLIKRIESQQSS